MSQSRIASLKESASNTAFGIAIAMVINVIAVNMIEDRTTAAIIGCLGCTVASLLRGYAIRRYYNRRAEETMADRENQETYTKDALVDYMTEGTWSPELRRAVDAAVSEARDAMYRLAHANGIDHRQDIQAMGPSEIINGIAFLARSNKVPAGLRADLLAIHDRSRAAAKEVLENWK